MDASQPDILNVSERNGVIAPGGEFLYTSSRTREEKKATLLGYDQKEGKLRAIYSVAGDTKPGNSTNYVDDLMESAISVADRKTVVFGGNIRRSNGEIEPRWAYVGKDNRKPDSVIVTKIVKDNSAKFSRLTRPVRLEEFVLLNSPKIE